MLSPPGRDAKRVVFSPHEDWSAFMVVPLVGRSDDVRRSAANPEDVREQLLAISQATVDQLLRPLRQPHGLSTTKAGRLLKKQIPIRTFTEWTDVKPGFSFDVGGSANVLG
jgi:hypothetical protein